MPDPQAAEEPRPSAETTEEIRARVEEVERFSSARIVRSALLFVVAGIALYGAATIATDYGTIAGALSRFPIGTLVLVLVLVVVGWLIRGLRFHYYLRKTDLTVPLSYSLAVFLASFSLTGTPGKMGEAVKGVFLKEDYGIPVTRVVGILVVERLMDLWGVLLLASFSFLLFPEWSVAFVVCAAVVIGGGVFLCMERLYRPILERMGRIRFLSWICEKALGVLVTGRELMTLRIFTVGLILSTIAWGLEAVSLYLILQGFGIDASLLEANFVYSFSTLVGALSMLPGGIGGTEAGMVGLLAFLGVSYQRALPPVLLIRLCTLWFAIVVGVGFTLGLLARRRRESATQ